MDDMTTVKNPAFDANKVCAVFKEAVTLEANMRNLQILSQMTGGRGLAVEMIEQTYISNGEQLFDQELIKKVGGLSACRYLYFKCFLVAFVAAFGWLAYEYYLANF